MVKIPPANVGDSRVVCLITGKEDPLEEGMAIHSSNHAWRIPWTEDLVVYSPYDHKESGRTEAIYYGHTNTHTHTYTHILITNVSFYSLPFVR